MEQVDRRVPIDPLSMYPMARIHSFARGMTRGEHRDGDAISYSHFRQLRAGDFVYQKLMAWEGGFALVPEEVDGCFVSTESCVFEFDESKLDRGFFSHLLAWEPFWRSLAEQAVGTNVRRRRLQPEQLLASTVPLPDIDDQRRIAAHLAQMHRAGTGLVGDSLPLNALEIVAADREWNTPLSELIELDVDEFDVEDSAKYPRAGVLNAGRGLFAQGELMGRDTKYRRLRRVRTGQIVLSRLKAFEGAVALTPATFDGYVLSQEFPTFTLRPGVPHDLVQALFTSPRFWGRLQATSTGVGARRERVSVEAFLGVGIPILTRAEQHKVQRLHRLLAAHRSLTDRRATLAVALLPAARNEVFSQFR